MRHKSRRSIRRIWRRLPSGRTVLRFVRRKKEGKQRCALCGVVLAGTQHTGPKSKKVPTRIFAGHLCHRCVREITRIAVMVKEGEKDINDVSLRMKKYVQTLVNKL